ncbi:hypothetical protein K432DRAFT_420081 [Lepidopterella palustris CBS 459.81]|uniref:Dienelactone hydrolase domain-containing protein n=1 Tax=Lepidopterella palustris CBS 459.81 TaxID=1314670 RepID=A0A8E2E034_9PEZI|nr:hypothetical protein K432DRAFT_420081 [Lepidopterella palustris CBS 459.81]
MAQQGNSAACCTIPPVSADYKEKGEFAAAAAIVLVYDIFGFSPQILQGADLLAHASSKHQYRVYMPDILVGNLADPAWFPPDTLEKSQAMGSYFGPQGPADANTMLAKLLSVVNAIKETSSPMEALGVLGYCWGAKIVSLASTADTPFKAAGEVHPSGLDPADAPKITIPLCMLASQDEDASLVKAFEEGLVVPKLVERYEEAPHGWMASRGDLEDAKGKADYERGYATVLAFL